MGRKPSFCKWANEINAEAGKYTLTLIVEKKEDRSFKEVYRKGRTYSKPDLSVKKWGSLEFVKTLGKYKPENLIVTVNNGGDLPAYLNTEIIINNITFERSEDIVPGHETVSLKGPRSRSTFAP